MTFTEMTTNLAGLKSGSQNEKAMNIRVVFIFPGQASQYVGMGREFYANSPAAAAVLDQVAALEGLARIPDLCFNGPAELLTRTDNVQPAITAVSIMALAALREKVTVTPWACIGHSLGEYAAHYAAGSLDLPLVMKLVQWRGFWMNEASQPPYPSGSMVAVMGLGREVLEHIVKNLDKKRIAVANLNSPGQVILSGETTVVEQAVEAAQAAGAKKTVMLNVSGAWHSPLMIPAARKMGELLERELTLEEVVFNRTSLVIANATAKVVGGTLTMRDTLTQQLTSPVRWEETIAKLISFSDEPLLFIEIGPGKVLKGILRSIDKNLEVLNVEDTAGAAAAALRIKEELTE